VHQWIVVAAVARDVAFRRSELLREGDLLVLAQPLIAKAQHLIATERVIDLAPGRRIQRLREV
jgi:hypothetical protein